MNNMIGKSGVDWSKAPEGAIGFDDDCGRQESVCWVKGEWGFWLNSVYRDDINMGWGTDRYILKKDDLPQQEQEKEMEYKCLQDLPVGTFVKDYEGDISLWNGCTLYTIDGEGSVKWDTTSIGNFEGFNYKFNGDCSIVSYSDKYNGEYKSLVPVKASPPWKIKHLKSPTYTCGKDVAITILHREVNDEVQYKYSICSKEDMFCKRTGIEVASNSTIYSHRPDITTGTALQTALYNLIQQPVSRQVKKLINDFLGGKE